MTNSADPDQKPTDLDLHYKGRAYSGSAGPGLKLLHEGIKDFDQTLQKRTLILSLPGPFCRNYCATARVRTQQFLQNGLCTLRRLMSTCLSRHSYQSMLCALWIIKDLATERSQGSDSLIEDSLRLARVSD